MNLRKPSRLAALLAGGALALAACGGSSATTDAASAPVDDAPADEAAASTFPQFVTATTGGGQLDFGSLEGQDTVLWFWAPW